ncbi:hypothetical protein GCM10010329_46420 [Streptomyces spiroverticillatus]|uniref:Uncharacterized protein n=1 Tax=Streptomyces finlayi TaxID=67296 RepID=A0A918X097_9ACTN|nr:hypothetical protein [Streptomyces finlayi]GHA18031.1 hypothetical protein GCM10010329_46420 [Streptomyces spiroverticillatus]GHC99734.1 hypothetical protein GCM10010334_43590 [Streptomyces finlayi]
MSTHEEHTVRDLGPMERGTSQRVASRHRMWSVAWSALCVLAALWSVAWAVGAIAGDGDAWAFAVPGLVLLAGALWARRSAIRNSPPRHL